MLTCFPCSITPLFVVILHQNSEKQTKQTMDNMKILMVAGLSLLLMACGGKKEEQVAPIRVKTEVVGEVADMSTRTYVGEVEAVSSTSVSFTGSGAVLRVYVEEGRPVSKGQVIAEMDATQARNALATSEAQMRQANDAYVRMKQLYDQKALAEIKWVEVQSQVAQAKAQLDMARKAVADCRIYAPVSGVIGKKMMDAGETALPSQVVATILDIRSVKVKVSIPETEIGDLTESTPSTISVEAAQATVNGGQIEKGVQADAFTHTYDIRINVDNSERVLLPGMVASVSFGGEELKVKSEKSVPVTSVQKRANGSLFVWVIDKDSTAHRKTVDIGQTMGNRIIVDSGIAKGERLVTEGYQKLSEGRKVVF